MLSHADTISITISHKQQQALRQLARQERQSVAELIAQLLQEGLDRRQQAKPPLTKVKQFEALARIEEHRHAFLAKWNQQPITVDPVLFLDEIREEHDPGLTQTSPLPPLQRRGGKLSPLPFRGGAGVGFWETA